MTSTVKVSAHCAHTKEVRVQLNGVPEATLQDGETRDFYVYDERVVTVQEVVKDASVQP